MQGNRDLVTSRSNLGLWFVIGALLVPVAPMIALGFRSSDVLLLVLVAHLALRSSRRYPGSNVRTAVAIIYCGAMIGAGIIIGTIVEAGSWTGAYQSVRYTATITIVAAVAMTLTHVQMRAVVRGIFGGTVATSLVGIVVYFGLVSGSLIENWVHAQRLGLWFSPNLLGNVLTFGLICGIYLYMKGDISIGVLFSAGASIFIAALCTLSLGANATGVAVVLVYIIVYSVGDLRRAKIAMALAIVGVAVFVFMAVGLSRWGAEYVPERFEQRIMPYVSFAMNGAMHGERDYGSLSLRIDYVKDAWEMIEQRPILGWGAGSARDANAYVHVTPLLLWVEGGILAVGGFALFLLIAIGRIWNSVLSRRPVAEATFAIASLLWFVSCAIRTPHMYQAVFYFPLVLAIAMTIDGRPSEKRRGIRV